MLFMPSDRRLLNEIRQSIAALDQKLDVHAQLVEMNELLRVILAKQGGMTPAEIDALAKRLNATTDRLDAIGQPKQ